MQTAMFTDEEQINLPKPVQDALGVRPGDRVGFEIRENGTVLVRVDHAKKVDLLSLGGILKPKVRGVTIAQMNETIREVGGSVA